MRFLKIPKTKLPNPKKVPKLGRVGIDLAQGTRMTLIKVLSGRKGQRLDGVSPYQWVLAKVT